MLKVHRTDVNETAYFSLAGRLDTNSAHEFDEAVKAAPLPEGDIIINTKGLEYISSAGLRIFLILSKTAKANGAQIKVENVSREVLEVFQITAFTEFLDIRPMQEDTVY